MKVILPTTFVDSRDITYPLFFFAGPVLGGGDWQDDAYRILSKRLSKFTAVVPCRYTAIHHLMRIRIKGDENRFKTQLEWERGYLAQAGTGRHPGCIVFWLPNESRIDPRRDGSPYGRDAYGELGEWRGRLINTKNVRMVIGGQEGFPGLTAIKANFDAVVQGEYSFYSTLEETLDVAIRKVN